MAKKTKIPDIEHPQGTGFARRTDFRWLTVGVVVFVLLAVVLPTPDSMFSKAESLYGDLPSQSQTTTSVATMAHNIKVTMALLAMCVVFFATEAVPLPAVALSIGLVQLLFGLTPPVKIVASYAHDAVWFIAGSLALGATLIKYGLDKRIGIIVINMAGTNIRWIIVGLLLGTSFVCLSEFVFAEFQTIFKGS